VRFPIDSSRLQFLVVAGAEPLKKFEDGKPREAWAPRLDSNGEVLWRVELVALGDGQAEIIRVAVPGDPGVGAGEMVLVEGMTAQAWGMDGRSGMTFPREHDPLGTLALGEGGGVMVRTTIDLHAVSGVWPAPFVSEHGRALQIAKHLQATGLAELGAG
jgi:hypothetical protein